MKHKFKLVKTAALLAMLSTFSLQFSTCLAQGTAFTYQGRLANGGTPANGSYDLAFSLFATNAGGEAVAGPVTNSATAVSDGLFTATIDFGAGAFTGASNWLQIAMRPSGGGNFTNLAPRQPITPAPYAMYAIAAGSVAGGLTIQQNTNGAPNVIGGSSVNYVSNTVVGATIAGGGAVSYNGDNLQTNSVTADFGTVSGGADNTASGRLATVGGGAGNTAGANSATVAGGAHNTASSSSATVSGGDGNIANGLYSTVSGGEANTASGMFATVGGGGFNIASGDGSFAAGQDAHAVHAGSFVWSDGSGGTFASTADNQFSARATGGARFVTGSAGLKLGSSAQYFASGGTENLRMIRGVVDSSGNRLHGTDFTVTRTGTGAYTVTFSSAFGDFPAVTVSAQSGVVRVATTTNVGVGSAQIRIFDGTGAAVDAQFHFIAIGLQ